MNNINKFLHSSDSFWVCLGLFSQFMFFLRFFIQWLASEIKKKSYIPTVFWYFSLIGSSGLLIYSIHRKDIVFMIGQSFGLLLYARNVYLSRPNKKATI